MAVKEVTKCLRSNIMTLNFLMIIPRKHRLFVLMVHQFALVTVIAKNASPATTTKTQTVISGKIYFLEKL